MRNVILGTKTVGAGHPCYVIAEIGGNFETLSDGQRLIRLAKQAGCDAVKLQTFRADTVTSKKAMFYMENTGEMPQWTHFVKYELSKDDHRALFEFAQDSGLFAFSTPSHPTDVDMLEELDAPAYKIGSDDAVNLPLLEYVAAFGKPILLSTGMCTLEEVEESVATIRAQGNDDIILFHCTTNYPTHVESVNLGAMVTMQRAFDFPVGYSDHTLGIDTCYAAAVLGAPILEFHFTDDKQGSGPDHMLSKDVAETTVLIQKLRELPVLLGDGVKKPAPSEAVTRENNRKSIVLTTDVAAGDRFTRENIDIKRPGTGIECKHWPDVLGKTARRDLAAEDVLNWDDVDWEQGA